MNLAGGKRMSKDYSAMCDGESQQEAGGAEWELSVLIAGIKTPSCMQSMGTKDIESAMDAESILQR